MNRAAFIDFCQGLLNLDPMQRWTPQQARLHPFITGEKFTKPFVVSASYPMMYCRIAHRAPTASKSCVYRSATAGPPSAAAAAASHSHGRPEEAIWWSCTSADERATSLSGCSFVQPTPRTAPGLYSSAAGGFSGSSECIQEPVYHSASSTANFCSSASTTGEARASQLFCSTCVIAA